MSQHEITVFLFSIGLLLACARVLGEISTWLRQPAVVGELLAGILLGPTVLGLFQPEWHASLFPAEGPIRVAMNGLTTLSISLFLLVAGIEVDLSSIWRQGSTAVKVGVFGMVIPFCVGFGCAWLAPIAMGAQAGSSPWIFSLFFATALAISALPVIAKTLLDLDLYRSDLGMVIVSAAVMDDLVGWLIFAIILGMMGTSATGLSIGTTIALTLVFALAMLTVVRWAIHRALPYIQAYTHTPGGVLSFSLSLALWGAALTEWIGIHAIFGAFLVGVAIGDSAHLRERTRATIENFVSFFFAPLFFGSVGLHIDFSSNFDPVLVMTVLTIACIGKLAGCTLGARWAGLSRRDGLAIAFGMNARGAMEIILGLLALQFGVIDVRLFVALVTMAIVTSMMSGPLVQWSLGRRKKQRLVDYLSSQRHLKLGAGDASQAIGELVRVACQGLPVDAALVRDAVLEREAALRTGIGRGVAVPHARIAGITAPIVAVGVSSEGVDFDAPDGLPAHAVFLLLTPEQDDGVQLEILAAIAAAFRVEGLADRISRSSNYTELLAALKIAGVEAARHVTQPVSAPA